MKEENKEICAFCGDAEATTCVQTDDGMQPICNDCLNELMRLAAENPAMASANEKQIMNSLQQEAEENIEKEMQDLVSKMYKTIKETSPKKLKDKLDEYVIGQEDAKKMLSLAVYNHYKRCLFHLAKQTQGLGNNEEDMPDEIEKSNIIMVGPSGTGKTYILKSLAKILDIPIAICDASTLTESGFVGSDVETVVRELYEVAGKDVLKTQFGIIFLDEFDKLARKSGDQNMITADPGREGVQQALLKVIEGGLVNFTKTGHRKHPDAATVTVDTSNILFVCGGAFEGIDSKIEERVATPVSMVLGEESSSLDSIDLTGLKDDEKYNKLIDNISEEDFKKYGIITEILGRLPVICKLHQLSEDDMLRILTEPKNALVKQYKALGKLVDNVDIDFTEEALREIAKQVIKEKIGARGLRAIIEKHIANAMFTASSASKGSAHVVITKECISDGVEPEVNIKVA